MTRDYIGDWGGELSPGAYSSALATLGVLVRTDFSSRRRVSDSADLASLLRLEWEKRSERLLWGVSDETYWERAKYVIPPGAAAQAWQNFVAVLPKPPRFEIISQYMNDDAVAATYPWLNQILMHLESKIASVFFEWWVNSRADRPARERTVWHWPLHIGFLPDSESRQLKSAIEAAPAWFYGKLTRFSLLTAGTEACDLLLSPLDAARTKIGIEAARARASAILLLRQHLPVMPDAFVELAEMRQLASTAAVGIVGSGNPTAYLVEFLRNVAHNAPFDTALHEALRPTGEVPLVIAGGSFIETARISTVPEQLADRLIGLGMEAEASNLLDSTRGLQFDSEEHGASVMLERMQPFTEKLRARPPRYIQARTLIPDLKDRSFHDADAFVRGTPHIVSIHVGPLARGERSSLSPFPEDRVRWSGDRERLTVVLTAPGCTVRALGESHSDPFDQPERIFEQLRFSGLPGELFDGDTTEGTAGFDRDGAVEAALTEISIWGGGQSTQGLFLLRPGEGERVAVRIMLLHANRVLQTAILEGAIVAAEDARSPRDKVGPTAISLRPEGVIHASLDELDERQRFDAAFVANRLLDRPSVTTVAGTEVKLRPFDEGKQAAENIRDVLKEVVDSPDDFSERDSEALRDLLIRLAQEGVLLYDSLIYDLGLGKALRDTTLRVQLISARPEAYLPLEFLYEGDAPDFESPLCPNRGVALQLGNCATCPNRGSGAVVCPVRFWGLNKIIERHAFRGEDAPESDRVQLDAPPSADRRFSLPTVGVFARSRRAERFPGGRAATKAVSASLRKTVATALSTGLWPEWKEQVRQHAPTLFVLLPHTDRTRFGTVLEIGDNSQLSAAQINAQIVGASENIMVILLGCDTADPSVAYASFPTRFRLAGAKIVVGTLTPILGRHAAPVAEALLDDLRGIWGTRSEGATLGEVMAGLRRRFMERGLPVGLALIAYGDADWILSGR
jgi:hypothetical protein